MQIVKKNYVIACSAILLISSLVSLPVKSQQTDVWRWQAWYNNEVDGNGNVFGTAASYQEALSSISGACSVCSKIAVASDDRFSGGQRVTTFAPSPNFFEAEYGEWYNDTSGVIQDNVAKIFSDPLCSPAFVTPSSDWADPNDPGFEPNISERRWFDRHVPFSVPGTTTCETHVFENFDRASRRRDPICPAGYSPTSQSQGEGFTYFCGTSISASIIGPSEDEKDSGCDGNNVGNPCNVATGNKFRAETDFSGGGFTFTRYYNSLGRNFNRDLGSRWSHSYQRRLLVSPSRNRIIFIKSDGKSESFYLTRVAGQPDVWQPDADSDYLLSEDESGYTLTLPSGSIERYGLNRYIESQTDTNGSVTTYEYEEENGISYLIKVTNEYGRSISFDYESVIRILQIFHQRRISKVTDSFGAVYEYDYGGVLDTNLISVTYPGLTPDDSSVRQYVYDDERYSHLLTGIIDANGERHATFTYDFDRRALTSELGTTTNAVGQEKIELDYQEEN